MNDIGKINVLLVDDAVLIIKRLSEMIGDVPCIDNIFCAYDYATAEKIIAEKNPNIVLLDIHLPDKSGIELLEHIKQNFSNIKVLMVTNKVAPFYKELCMAKGANHFIDKSKEFENIAEILESYCMP